MKLKGLRTLTLVAAVILFVSCTTPPEITLVQIPGQNYRMGQTEITQEQFKKVMKINPSTFKGNSLPVGNISWNDAIYFCNTLSLMCHLEPVYYIEGSSNPKDWNYEPCHDEKLSDNLVIDYKANGYRLPTNDEWVYAAYGNENTLFSGGNVVEEVSWMSHNSEGTPHQVGTKKPNAFGLYDMSGNVWEWTDTMPWNHQRSFKGGSWKFMTMYSRVDSNTISTHPFCRAEDMGFRVCRNTIEN